MIEARPEAGFFWNPHEPRENVPPGDGTHEANPPLPGILTPRLGRVVLVLWTIAVMIGVALWWRYESHPGERGIAPRKWPASSRIARNANGATLLVFLHPNCPCSKATVHSLQNVLATLPGTPPQIIFVIRPAASDDWRARSLIAQAADTSGARFFYDDDESEIRRFATRVSGHVLLYDKRGSLAFDGGVTAQRGQEGPNLSEDRLRALLNGPGGTPIQTVVFGCPLQNGVPPQTRRPARCKTQ